MSYYTTSFTTLTEKKDEKGRRRGLKTKEFMSSNKSSEFSLQLDDDTQDECM